MKTATPLVSLQSKYSDKQRHQEVNYGLIYSILDSSNQPLSRRDIRKILANKYDRQHDVSSLCAPLDYLEKIVRISWVKRKCTVTGHKVKHYYTTPYDLEPGRYYDWDEETDQKVVRGKAVEPLQKEA